MKSTYVFLGDSITNANRFWSTLHPGIGDGYVQSLSDQITQKDPGAAIYNKGYDGLTVSALLQRLNNGSIFIPESNHLCLQIGINDISVSMNTGVSLKEQLFNHIYEEVLLYLKQKTNHLLCLGPCAFSRPDEYQLWIPEINYAEHCILALKEKYAFDYFSLQSFFKDQESLYSIQQLSIDGIHPTSYGHRLLAEHIIHYFL